MPKFIKDYKARLIPLLFSISITWWTMDSLMGGITPPYLRMIIIISCIVFAGMIYAGNSKTGLILFSFGTVLYFLFIIFILKSIDQRGFGYIGWLASIDSNSINVNTDTYAAVTIFLISYMFSAIIYYFTCIRDRIVFVFITGCIPLILHSAKTSKGVTLPFILFVSMFFCLFIGKNRKLIERGEPKRFSHNDSGSSPSSSDFKYERSKGYANHGFSSSASSANLQHNGSKRHVRHGSFSTPSSADFTYGVPKGYVQYGWYLGAVFLFVIIVLGLSVVLPKPIISPKLAEFDQVVYQVVRPLINAGRGGENQGSELYTLNHNSRVSDLSSAIAPTSDRILFRVDAGEPLYLRAQAKDQYYNNCWITGDTELTKGYPIRNFQNRCLQLDALTNMLCRMDESSLQELGFSNPDEIRLKPDFPSEMKMATISYNTIRTDRYMTTPGMYSLSSKVQSIEPEMNELGLCYLPDSRPVPQEKYQVRYIPSAMPSSAQMAVQIQMNKEIWQKIKDTMQTIFNEDSISDTAQMALSEKSISDRTQTAFSDNSISDTAQITLSDNSISDTAKITLSENSISDTAQITLSENSISDTAQTTPSENSTNDTAQTAFSEKSIIDLKSQEAYIMTVLTDTDNEMDIAYLYFLDLPDSLSGRIYELAASITAGKTSDYDKARAIENYFHSSDYKYTTNPPRLPDGKDINDYFLFESRKGFCVHFASAMVILARACGLPARYVEGYVTGEYYEVPDHYYVRALDAHAFPEIYIAGSGWMAFEPTVSSTDENGFLVFFRLIGDWFRRNISNLIQIHRDISPVARMLILPFILFTVIYSIWLFTMLRYRSWMKRTMKADTNHALKRIFTRIVSLLQKTKIEIKQFETPTLYALRVLQEKGINITELTDAYNRVKYGRYSLTDEELTCALKVYNEVVACVKKRIGKLKGWLIH
jgi:hypothetical protein